MDLGQLQLAARSAGLPLDFMERVSRVQQPVASGAVVNGFTAMLCHLARHMSDAMSANPPPMSYIMNPSGQAWLLLAFPDGTEDDALRMFEDDTADQQAGVHRIALAGPAYEGVAVLARGLLGPALVLANGALSFETIFSEEPGAGVDPRKWSVGCFRTRNQLLPIFLIHVSAALHADLQGEVIRLKRKNSYLQSGHKIQAGITNRVREALRSRQRRAKHKEDDYVMGHKRVKVAEIQQPETSLHHIDLNSEIEHETQLMEEANGPSMVRRTRGAGTPGEMALESIYVKLPGGKRKRKSADGTSPGGLEWDNRVLLNAVLLYTLAHSSLKEAGSAGLSFLSRLALECFIKAEPRNGYQSRRIDSDKAIPVFKPVSAASVRCGVAAFELAKNEEFGEWLRNCDVLNLGHDATSVGPWSVQCLHVRGIKRVYLYTDAAGTRKLGAEARSMSLDLKASGDKFQTEFLVMGEDGQPRRTLITAGSNFGAQLHQSGLYYVVSRHPALTVVSDGGGEGAGKGNRAVVRQSMAGENSVGHLTFLLQRAGDNGMKLLNAAGLWVPLMEAYGFDPLSGDISTRKPEAERVDTTQRMLNEAMRAHRKKAGSAAASSSESSSDEDEETVFLTGEEEVSHSVEDGSVASPKPIYDPLRGPPAPGNPAVQAMSFFEFVLWDISSAYPDLRLAATMSDVTEEMVAAVEELVSIMRDEALTLPFDPAKCKKISIAGFSSLKKGKFVADDAIDLVLEEVTHVLGGRFVSKGGMYTTGPVSPLIRSIQPTEASYVIGSQNAGRLVNCVNRAETYAASKKSNGRGNRKAVKELADMVGVLRSRPRRGHARQQTDENKVVFEPGSKLFAFTHLTGHYVSTEVANLGASTEVREGAGSSRNAATITRADSNSLTPQFSGCMHTALHIALRALGAIGTTQEVDHFGLPLPPQNLPDCAFYTLGRLLSWLTGEFPPPAQWQFNTRLLRCWTDFQAYRQLRHNGAILDVLGTSLDKFRQWQQAQGQRAMVPDAVTEAQALDPLAMPSLQRQPTKHALTEFWERAIAALPGAEGQRRLSKRKELKRTLLDEVLKQASKLADAAYKPEARDMPRQLCTTGPVMASASPPLGAGDNWTERYSDLVQGADSRTSMDKNPFRYFLMAERDKRGETGGAEQSGASEPSGEQDSDETSRAGQGGASGANGRQRSQEGRWRAITNALLMWCIRHRGHLSAEDVFKRTDRLPNRAERAVNSARGPFVWPRACEHMQAYLGLPPPRGRDCVRPGPIHEAVQGAMKAHAETWGPPRGKMAIKLRMKSGKPATETEVTPRSYHDRMMEEISETGRLQKPLACAQTRWGTRAAAFRWLSVYSRLMAAAYVHTHGQGTEAALADTAKDVFNVHGWVDKCNTRTPKPIGKQLHLLLNQTDILMLGIGGFVEQIMIGPMMNAMSHNLESSSTSVCGIDSFFRKLLHFVKGHLFVGKFNLFDSFTGSDTAADFATKKGRLLAFKSYAYEGRKGGRLELLEKRRIGLAEDASPPAMVRLAHRGVETLRGAHMRNAFLINPLADVRGVMGRFCSDSMAGCVTTLLEGLRRASLVSINKLGKWSEIVLYPTLEQQWQREMAPHFKKQMGPEVDVVPVDAAGLKAWESTQSQRFQRNMIKAQWAVAQIVRHDMVESIVKWFDHELYCILGFLACSLETRTVKARKTDDPNRKIVDVLVANKFAVPNLMVAFRMLDEVVSHWPNEYLQDFVPSQLGNLMRSGQAMLQAGEFALGEDIKGFVLVDEDGRDILDKDGNPMPVGPAPLERWEKLAAQVHDLALLMRSNNDVERVFTHASRGFSRGGRHVTPTIISSWVRRKDWISAGLWGKEKDASFLKKFSKWRCFVSAHYQRLQRLSLPDVAGAEEKKMAAQLAKLALKYKNGNRFAESHIAPSKDFFSFGQKAPRDDDAEDAPTRGKRTSSGEKLRQRARAARAHNLHQIPISKKSISKKRGLKAAAKKANKAKRTARSATAPPVAPVAAGLRSDGEDGGQGDTGEYVDDWATDWATPVQDNDRKSDGGNAAADLDPSSPASASSLPGGASGGESVNRETRQHASTAVELGPHAGPARVEPVGSTGAHGAARTDHCSQAAGAGPPRAQPVRSKEEHQSFVQVREWINSSAVKDARKKIRDKAKATKDAATVAVTGASRLGPDAAAAKEDESHETANGSDSDEGDEEWAPSSVTANTRGYIVVTRLVGGESYRVNKGRMSSLTLHHVYDHQTGESQLVQIQSVRYDKAEKVWKIQYCRVYRTEQAILAAEQEEDKQVVLRGGEQDEKILIQRGRKHLRDVHSDSDLLHHIGDVRKTSQPVYILGIAAWLPASALICEAAQLAKRKEELRIELVKHCGLKADEARRLAADPIYVGEYFSEVRSAEYDEEASDSSDAVSDSAEQSAGRADALVQRPSRRPLRRLREKISSGKPMNFTDDLDDDDDDEPLFGKTSPKAIPACQGSDSGSDADSPSKSMKREAARGVVGAAKMAARRGGAGAAGRVSGGGGSEEENRMKKS